ncbi:MAG: SGNH/GDSL hydrolase family protein [Ancalomicrobiaceae bacterium]|nr:SGNH/GDSL hydrolase family protein [Ancalomicrobiaceae bacterium]
MGVAVALLAGMVVPAAAAPVYVVGDSIGQDLGRVAKQTTFAKISVSLANRWIYRQLPSVPDGATVVLTIGTNDADETNGVRHLGKHIDALIAYLNEHRLKAYWLGPVCVTTGSAARAEELDRILANRLKATTVTYVSLHTPELCSPDLHARDGQHMRDAGSKRIWQDLARVAGWPEASEQPVLAKVEPPAAAPTPPAQVAPAPAPTAPLATAPAPATSPAVVPAPLRPVNFPLPPVKPNLGTKKSVADKSNLPHLAPKPVEEEQVAPRPAAVPQVAAPPAVAEPAPIPPAPIPLAAEPIAKVEPPMVQSIAPPPKPVPPPAAAPPPAKVRQGPCIFGWFFC